MRAIQEAGGMGRAKLKSAKEDRKRKKKEGEEEEEGKGGAGGGGGKVSLFICMSACSNNSYDCKSFNNISSPF